MSVSVPGRCDEIEFDRLQHACDTSGRSVRIIGFSEIADDIITVIVLEIDGTEYGVNGWAASS
jgi:hypothetical protein